MHRKIVLALMVATCVAITALAGADKKNRSGGAPFKVHIAISNYVNRIPGDPGYPEDCPTDPCNGSGTGNLDGLMTPGGKFTGYFISCVDFCTLTGSGVDHLVTRNGDELIIEWNLAFDPAVGLVLDGIVNGGTGRFANATGSVHGLLAGDSAEYEGYISLGQGH